MNPQDMFKGLYRAILGDEKYVSCAQLRPEDLLRYKAYRQNSRKLQDELKLLLAKGAALSAQDTAATAEFWHWLYGAYGLPSDESYQIDEKGLVEKRVRKPNNG